VGVTPTCNNRVSALLQHSCVVPMNGTPTCSLWEPQLWQGKQQDPWQHTTLHLTRQDSCGDESRLALACEPMWLIPIASAVPFLSDIGWAIRNPLHNTLDSGGILFHLVCWLSLRRTFQGHRVNCLGLLHDHMSARNHIVAQHRAASCTWPCSTSNNSHASTQGSRSLGLD